VLQTLRQHGLKVKLSKCEFNKPELHFLGHVIEKEGVAVDPAKVAVISKWPVPKSLKELQAFLGLVNYFRKFMEHFGLVVAPLTCLTGQTGKGKARTPTMPVDWNNLGEEAIPAFNEIKRRLVTAPVLAIPDLNKPLQVYSDASVAGTGGVLMQEGRVFLYTSPKFAQAEFNYGTPEQDLLGLVRALQVGGAIWRALQTVDSSQTITHSSTCKPSPICQEDRQGGWSFCHVSHLSLSTRKARQMWQTR